MSNNILTFLLAYWIWILLFIGGIGIFLQFFSMDHKRGTPAQLIVHLKD